MSEAVSVLSLPRVKAWALEAGADEVGVASAHPVSARELFLAWLQAGYAGEMEYLHRHQEQRFDPERLLPGARSVIVIGLNYCPDPDRQAQGPLRVAKYAWGEDYHRTMRRILRRLRTRLRRECPQLAGRICVDTAPFPDKYWAMQAGVGWQGKHTNLVSRDFGSWLLLGSLVVDRPLDAYDAPHLDFCGSCTACLDACPTRAFPAAYQLDATRCISYWTIESSAEKIPEAIAQNSDGWVFGCDICLDVCPWNRFEAPHAHPAFDRREGVSAVESGEVRELDEEAFQARYGGTAFTRPGQRGLARNIEAGRRSLEHPV